MRERIKQLKKISQQGFTLIELMAVLAILAILLAIAIPAIGKLIDKSDASSDKSSIELMEHAGELAHTNKLEFDEPNAGIPEESYMIPTLIEEGYLDLDEDSKFNLPENYVVKESANSSGTFIYKGIGALPGTDVEPEDTFIPVTVVPDGCTGITTAAELDAIRDDMTGCYVVMNPIDLSSFPSWEPLLSSSGDWFKGSFDGQRYPITGLVIDKAGEYYVGLFSDVEEGAVLKNVNLVNVDVTGGEGTGGLVGYLDAATVENSSVSGTVKGTGEYMGGLSGEVYSSAITDSRSDVVVSSEGVITGGLVGYGGNVTISNSYSKGSVTAKDSVGGLVGQLDDYGGVSTVTDSHSTASVTATESEADAAGLVSSIQGTTIENSYATGAVKSTSSDLGTGTVGGLIGDSDSSNIKNSYATGSVTGNGIAGGFIGNSTDTMRIENSYSTGTVTNSDDTSNAWEQYTGGFAGFIGADIVIKNSYSSSTVTGNLTQPTDAIGGFVGFANYGTTIENSYYFGVATSSNISGGFIGFIPPEYAAEVAVTNSYYSSDKTGQNDAIFGTPVSTTQFGQQSTFTDWDFTDVWEIKVSAYPTLK